MKTMQTMLITIRRRIMGGLGRSSTKGAGSYASRVIQSMAIKQGIKGL